MFHQRITAAPLSKVAIILIMVGTQLLGHSRPQISRRHVTADLEREALREALMTLSSCFLPVLAGYPSSVQTLIADVPALGHPVSLAWEAPRFLLLLFSPPKLPALGF